LHPNWIFRREKKIINGFMRIAYDDDFLFRLLLNFILNANFHDASNKRTIGECERCTLMHSNAMPFVTNVDKEF
jgi:hypothetical protein